MTMQLQHSFRPAIDPGNSVRIQLFTGKRLLALSVFLLLGVFFVRQIITRAADPTPGEIEQQLGQITYDAYSSGITSILYTAEGHIEYTLEATEQIHYLNNTTLLSNPFVRLYQDSGVRWNILARSGRIHAANDSETIEQLDLIDEVELFQTDDQGNRITLTTDFISLFPGTETMSTQQEVTMRSDSLLQTALGMHADLRQDKLTFQSQVKGRYEVESSQP
jgi:LPS export ABC transporter protein LptC